MGTDKARLPLGSHCLIEDVAGKISAAAGNVALVGSPDRYVDLPFECLEDLRPGFGPISGIEAALASRRGDLNLIAGCDMPRLEIGSLRELVAQARSSGALCVVARDADCRTHPLCAVYKSACLPVVSRAIDERRLKLMDLIAELKPEYVFIKHSLPNLNHPEDWISWQEKEGFSFDRVKRV
jgi:molybdopterin-guanine dinucleotide biosynthesis protein A